MTMSLALVTSATLDLGLAPSAASNSTGLATTSCTASAKPLRTRFDAMGLPMLPSPMNPIVAIGAFRVEGDPCDSVPETQPPPPGRRRESKTTSPVHQCVKQPELRRANRATIRYAP